MRGDPRESDFASDDPGLLAAWAGLRAALTPTTAALQPAPMDSDWLESEASSQPTNLRHAERCLQEGLRAHGSLALGAQVSLALLARAAPPDLVDGAQALGLANLRHARRAFSAAHLHGGARLAPADLPLTAPPEPLASWAVGWALGTLLDLHLEAVLARDAQSTLWDARREDHGALLDYLVELLRWFPEAERTWQQLAPSLKTSSSWRLDATRAEALQEAMRSVSGCWASPR